MFWKQIIASILINFNLYVIRWIWNQFNFLLEHITTHLQRRTVASFTARLPAAGAPPVPAIEAPEAVPPAPDNEALEDASCASTPATRASSTASTNPDLLLGLLQTFLTDRQSQAHPAMAFGSYVDGSLRNLPPAIRRTAEARIIEVLHDCGQEADRHQFRPIPQRPTPADRQGPGCREPPLQRTARFSKEPLVRQWQPSPSQWPAQVTNPPGVWHSMDRQWVQDQFPEMNITCPPPTTENQPHQSSSTEPPSTSAADMQEVSHRQMATSESFSALLSSIPSPDSERWTNTTPTADKEKP